MSTISDLLSGLNTLLATERDAYGLAHDVAHALPSLDDGTLRELRNRLAQTEPDDPLVNAVATTLVEIVDGYRLGRQHTVTLSLRAGINRDVLCALEQGVATTSELAETLSRDESQISRSITRLRELDLIDPPQRDAAVRRRIEHRLSLAAKRALGRLDRRARKAAVWQLSPSGSLEERNVSVDEEQVRPQPVMAPSAEDAGQLVGHVDQQLQADLDTVSVDKGPAPRLAAWHDRQKSLLEFVSRPVRYTTPSRKRMQGKFVNLKYGGRHLTSSIAANEGNPTWKRSSAR
jgi:DNA-binding MarR family transcriptional regulator